MKKKTCHVSAKKRRRLKATANPGFPASTTMESMVDPEAMAKIEEQRRQLRNADFNGSR